MSPTTGLVPEHGQFIAATIDLFLAFDNPPTSQKGEKLPMEKNYYYLSPVLVSDCKLPILLWSPACWWHSLVLQPRSVLAVSFHWFWYPDQFCHVGLGSCGPFLDALSAALIALLVCFD